MRRVQSNTLDVGIDVHLKNWSTAILSKHSVLRRFLQVDCEGPTLISYIVAKHLAHASRGTISPYRTNGSAYGGFVLVHLTVCDKLFSAIPSRYVTSILLSDSVLSSWIESSFRTSDEVSHKVTFIYSCTARFSPSL